MDPSLIEIITTAVRTSRRAGLSAGEQRDAAQAVLVAMVPSLAPAIAQLIVDQLYPFVPEAEIAA